MRKIVPYFARNMIILSTALTLVLTVVGCQRDSVGIGESKGGSAEVNSAYLMTYFRSGPNQTDMTRKLHYAFSRDGLHWYELNNNKAVWSTPVGGEIIRDPFMNKGPDGNYYLVHTMHSEPFSPYAKKQIGFAQTSDLITFTDAKPLNVMENYGQVGNSWAPEWNWDETSGRYMIHWSSTLNSDKGNDNRIFKSYTKDWITFTPAEPLFDPRYSIIDSNVTQHNGKNYLFFKDELTRPMRNRVAVSERIDGGYGRISELITPTTTEAAQVLQLTGQQKWYLYYDYWADGKYGVMESTDMVNWSKELKQEHIRFPYQRRHASFFPISEEELFRLINHFSLLARYQMDVSSGKLFKVETANEDFLQESYSLRTVSLWMKADRTDGTQILYDEGSENAGFVIRIEKGRLQASVADGGKNGVVSAQMKDTGSWHHVAAVFSEGSMKLYVDGELKDTAKTSFQTISAHSGDGGNGRRIGKDAIGGSGEEANSSGVLSELAIYDTPLQDADVSYLYKAEVNQMR